MAGQSMLDWGNNGVKCLPGTDMIKTAEQLAREAHQGQCRKDGTPYITHVEAVVGQLKGDEIAQTVAWLHDVLEDTSLTVPDLTAAGMAPEVINVVILLTVRREQTHNQYLDQIKSNPIATKVKIADLIANLNDCPGKKQIRKFAKALLRLTSP
jgi:(p)ppGpp synthase/HD superfamily hydrolase